MTRQSGRCRVSHPQLDCFAFGLCGMVSQCRIGFFRADIFVRMARRYGEAT